MKLASLLFIVTMLFAQQGASTNPVITQTNPPVPASLTIFADHGDLTYCVATANTTQPQFSLTCRRSGVTHLPGFIVSETISIGDGDVFWMFTYDKANPKLVHFQASVNVRDAQGLYVNTILKSQGDALWK